MSDTREPAAGDPVEWWDDGHGRGVAPDEPGAMRCTGVVASVDRTADGRAVVYLVRRKSVGGEYLAPVRPDLGHRLVLIEGE
ncbi:hypothetical protein [Nocardia brasiliensis]|uniref:hypothetical protein n=1 Tax=Nocardia brasiliensis TaxID=37326 RepID=UPI001895CE49|nr:hypothetical protein [Nocardia brasiliensis]MBF6548851.1 hypothetical protein [Nocardia brasiliensis]